MEKKYFDTDKWIEELFQKKLVAILRNVPEERVEHTVEALYQGGIHFLEITFNQKEDPMETARAIALVREKYDTHMHVGAGTVFSKKQADLAMEAGAEFLLSPHTDINLIQYTVEKHCISVPGAFTPSEIAAAWQAGAHVVKLFPAGNLGVDYVKAIRAPINHIPLMAVGGVHENNLCTFLKAGIECFGIGSNIADRKLICEGKYQELEQRAKLYTSKIQSFRRGEK